MVTAIVRLSFRISGFLMLALKGYKSIDKILKCNTNYVRTHHPGYTDEDIEVELNVGCTGSHNRIGVKQKKPF